MSSVQEVSKSARRIGEFYKHVAQNDAAVKRLVDRSFSEQTVSKMAVRLDTKLTDVDIKAASAVLAEVFALAEEGDVSAEAVVQVAVPVIVIVGGGAAGGITLGEIGALMGGLGTLMLGIAAIAAVANGGGDEPEEESGEESGEEGESGGGTGDTGDSGGDTGG